MLLWMYKLTSHDLKYLKPHQTLQSHILPAKLMLYCFCWRLTAVKWRSHRLSHHEIKWKACVLIIVQWWNADAFPGCDCWAAASAVSTGGDHAGQQQRKQRWSDYGSAAEWMNWPEPRAARRFSEASTSTSVRKGFTWCDVNALIVNLLNYFNVRTL